jgi:uncharacterized protein (TIGR04141 family)
LGAVCLDKQCGRSELGATPVEFCDLLLADGTFVHVKRADGSQSLSHLFAQGSTSTLLLARSDERFRADLDQILAARAPRHPLRTTLRSTGVVYAIGTRSGQPVHDALFTIAKVGLLAHSEIINATGTPLTWQRSNGREVSTGGNPAWQPSAGPIGAAVAPWLLARLSSERHQPRPIGPGRIIDS